MEKPAYVVRAVFFYPDPCGNTVPVDQVIHKFPLDRFLFRRVRLFQPFLRFFLFDKNFHNVNQILDGILVPAGKSLFAHINRAWNGWPPAPEGVMQS